MPPHPLTNFDIQKYYPIKPQLNGVYLRNNLSKIKDGASVINLDEYKLIGTHWITLYEKDDNVTNFYSLGVEHIPKEIKKFISNKNIKTDVSKIQANGSIMCGYYCTGFIDFMLKGNSLLDCTNLLSRNEYEKNDKIILKYFH